MNRESTKANSKLAILGLLLLLASAVVVFSYRFADVFIGDDIYFIDADCYSRMIRAQSIWDHGLHSISFQNTENWPDGVLTHTTMPMDVAIVGLAYLLQPFATHPLPLAGAWISPLLGVILLITIWIWSRVWELSYHWMMLLLAVLSPSFAHAFSVGRPDHQSLILLLVGLAIFAEVQLWSLVKSNSSATQESPPRQTPIILTIAIFWGLALWVSLYEPLILFVVVGILRLLVLGRKALTRRFLVGYILTFTILCFAWLIDGIRISRLPLETIEYFGRWSSQIGELRTMPFGSSQAYTWVGWLLTLVPLLLLWRTFKERSGIWLALLILLATCYGLTMWQRRWEYILVLVFIITLPRAMQVIRWKWLSWMLFVLSLWPLAAQWELVVYPTDEQSVMRLESRKESVLLREAAIHMISNKETPFLAPWWLCPPISYWSQQPAIAGSSHQSLPGIVDTARFYLSESEAEAMEIIKRRRVVYIFGYDTHRVLDTASPLLGKPGSTQSMGARIFHSSRQIPPWLHLVYSNDFFRIYEVH